MDGVDQVLQRHLPALRAFVRLRAGPLVAARESVSDLVQSVCREVLAGSERIEFQGDAAFKSWLFTTALRKIVDRDRFYKAKKRDVRRETPVLDRSSAAEQQSMLDQYATFATPSRELATHEQMAAVERAFAQLSEQHREVITQARIVGLPHEEIAKSMAITVEGSRQLLRRALVRLSTLLEQSREA